MLWEFHLYEVKICVDVGIPNPINGFGKPFASKSRNWIFFYPDDLNFVDLTE